MKSLLFVIGPYPCRIPYTQHTLSHLCPVHFSKSPSYTKITHGTYILIHTETNGKRRRRRGRPPAVPERHPLRGDESVKRSSAMTVSNNRQAASGSSFLAVSSLSAQSTPKSRIRAGTRETASGVVGGGVVLVGPGCRV